MSNEHQESSIPDQGAKNPLRNSRNIEIPKTEMAKKTENIDVEQRKDQCETTETPQLDKMSSKAPNVLHGKQVFSTFGQGLSDTDVASKVVSPSTTPPILESKTPLEHSGRFGPSEEINQSRYKVSDYSPNMIGSVLQPKTFHIRKGSKAQKVKPIERYKNLQSIYNQKVSATTMGARSANFSQTFSQNSQSQHQKTVISSYKTTGFSKKEPPKIEFYKDSPQIQIKKTLKLAPKLPEINKKPINYLDSQNYYLIKPKRQMAAPLSATRKSSQEFVEFKQPIIRAKTTDKTGRRRDIKIIPSVEEKYKRVQNSEKVSVSNYTKSSNMPTFSKFKFAKRSPQRSISLEKAPKLLNFQEYKQMATSAIKHEEKFQRYMEMPKTLDVIRLRKVSNSRERNVYSKDTTYPQIVLDLVQKYDLTQAQKDKLNTLIIKRQIKNKSLDEKKALLKNLEENLEFYNQQAAESMQITKQSLETRIQKVEKFLSFYSSSEDQICQDYVIDNQIFIEI